MKCDQEQSFYIPSKDLSMCQLCENNCRVCKYSYIEDDFSILRNIDINYFQNLEHYQQYCMQCLPDFFISYNGKCELCDIKNCSLCYYGEAKGADIYFTLINDFKYRSEKGKLLKKCYECKEEENIIMVINQEGKCTVFEGDVSTLD